ncbi:DUF72 domain-containing protein [Luteimonas sp. FCS-9]|uniref:DUF72 domain-containing protein n=1 Tax=Luteimonas sp. FCS-9 TaxID=1547516 RepID=UPI00063EB307|nr:DUF72 domain-containing protein [Luteimonas sp. FCS-9]KLI98889.1 hypothetical protein WQ56_13935 [Luteimonas sp. FCS-9]
MTIRIGISGWRYAPWRRVFYPEGLVQRDELAFAARRFGTIEINGSFYSLQSPRSWRAWRDATPPGFVFAVKGPRLITHMKRLRDVETPLANFLASGVLALDDRLGPLLWQLPPQLAFDPARIGAFLRLLPRDTGAALALARRREPALMKGRSALPRLRERPIRHALEVRHASFQTPEFVAMLRAHGVGLVVSDSAGRHPVTEDVTADFVYIRLHGDTELYTSGYGKAALDRWARRIARWAAGGEPRDAARSASRAPRAPGGRDVYCYFDNDAKVHAPFDAQALAGRLRRRGGARPG